MKTSTFLFAALSMSMMVSMFTIDSDAGQKVKTKSNSANDRVMNPTLEVPAVSAESAKNAVEIVNSAKFLAASKKNDVRAMKTMLSGTGVVVKSVSAPLPCLAPLAWQGMQLMQNTGNGTMALVWSVQCTGWAM